MVKLYEWLCVLGVPGLIVLVWSTALNRRVRRGEQQAEAHRRKAEEDARKSEERADQLLKQQVAIMLGIQALLRDRLRQGYLYYLGRGWANYEDRSDMETMYEQYHALGQNGAMDDMRQKFMELPYAP